MGIPHPIPYQGSKRAFARHIVGYLPMDAERLIEPFAGSAAVTLAAAFFHKTKTFLISDVNRALMALWTEIVQRPKLLADRYEQLWNAQHGQERRFYDTIREEFNRTQRPDCFLYLLARCTKAAVRYNPQGKFNQSPDNRRKGARPDEMRARILEAASLLKGKADIRCADYRDIVNLASPADVVYMDPPYQGVSEGRDRRYASTLPFASFVSTLQDLNKREISFIVSYDGRTGTKIFGRALPDLLNLVRIEIHAGRSSQATLLGRQDDTVESLYLSPSLIRRVGQIPPRTIEVRGVQPQLLSTSS